ncbi:hypothetical protein GF362_05000 [Candidatus Dojkabacteria bacterium]|nr:hypothetical protein [Candidatus Dojkabacteria bacterium]
MLKRKLKIGISFVISLSFLLFLFSSEVFGAELKIIRPTSGEKVSGMYQIGWSGFYTGHHSFPYEIRVKNATCSDNGIAIISPNFSSSQLNGQYTHTWNTTNVTDGIHCLQYCIQLDDGSPQCVYQTFNVVNYSNNSPVITSYPSQLNFNTQEIFEYQIHATDADGDTLFYQLLQAPDFIYLDQDGYMSLGDYMNPGVYNISIVVLDGLGGMDQQSFQISVVEEELTPTATNEPNPTVSRTPGPTWTSTESPTEEPPDSGEPRLMILKPDEGSVFSGRNNEIEWDWAGIDSEDIEEIVIEYTASEEEMFEEIYKHDGSPMKTYEWDVSEIENGDYYVRVILFDEDGKEIAVDSSGVFLVANKEGEEQILTIYEITPANKAEVDELQPVLSAKFEASESGEIDVDSIKIIFDGKNISDDCSIDESGFECEISEDLDYEEYEVEVTVEDTNGESLKKAWSFSVVGEGNGGGDDDGDSGGGFNWDDFDFDNLKSFYPWCGVILFILLLLFIISLLKKKSDMI